MEKYPPSLRCAKMVTRKNSLMNISMGDFPILKIRKENNTITIRLVIHRLRKIIHFYYNISIQNMSIKIDVAIVALTQMLIMH